MEKLKDKKFVGMVTAVAFVLLFLTQLLAVGARIIFGLEDCDSFFEFVAMVYSSFDGIANILLLLLNLVGALAFAMISFMKDKVDPEKQELAKKMVPFVLWANAIACFWISIELFDELLFNLRYIKPLTVICFCLAGLCGLVQSVTVGIVAIRANQSSVAEGKKQFLAYAPVAVYAVGAVGGVLMGLIGSFTFFSFVLYMLALLSEIVMILILGLVVYRNTLSDENEI